MVLTWDEVLTEQKDRAVCALGLMTEIDECNKHRADIEAIQRCEATESRNE